MDFWNSIWFAVSTPNEVLVNISFIFLIPFIDAPLSLSIIKNIFGISYNKLKKYTFILITSIVGLLSMFIIPEPFNILLNYLSAFTMLYFIFNLNLIKSFIAALFPSIIFNLIGFLILNPYLYIFQLTYNEVQLIPLYRVSFALIMYGIVFILALILKFKNVRLKILDNFDSKNKFIIVLNFIFGCFYIIVQSILTINYIDILPIGFTFFNFICLLIYFGLSFYSLTKVMNLVITTQKLQTAEEYNKTLHILHDNVRGFKHDFDNIVTTIGGFIKTNDMNGLKKYYSQLEEDCKKVNNLYLLDPNIINNPGIYSLLTTKYSEAIEKQITVNLTFLLDLDKLNMKIYDFTRILGILLDNSIDASSESDEKILNIVFRNDSKNNRNIILIENTYNNKDVDLENIFNKGVTGKENHTGLGLWEIRQILKKNNNVNLHTTKNEQYFSQQLEIYY